MNPLKKVVRVADILISFPAFLAGILIFCMMLVIVVEVVIRSFWAGLMPAFFWMIESIEYALLFIAFLSATWLLKRERHVKMDLVLNRLNPRTQSVVNIITSSLCTIVCLIIACYGVMTVWGYFQTGLHLSTTLRPAKWPLASVIPLGFFLLSFQFLRRTYGYLQRWGVSLGKER